MNNKKNCQNWFLPTGNKKAFMLVIYPDGSIKLTRANYKIDSDGVVQHQPLRRWNGTEDK